MKKTILTIACSLLSMGMLQAQTAREEIAQIPERSGGNYLNYELVPLKSLTKTPKGYEPFYISHYGRHGSRWLLGDNEYKGIIDQLEKAKTDGVLTAKGEEMLSRLKAFYPCTKKRLGELTSVGERQHHNIGKRMTENFPEVFSGKADVNARSTTVVRCMMSMEAECEEIYAFNPKMTIHNDVSESFQYYMNRGTEPVLRRLQNSAERGKAMNEANQMFTHPDRFCAQLFSQPNYAQDSIRGGAGRFMNSVYNVATNMQSHDTDIDLLSFFTNDELYDQWRIKNIDWYLQHGAAPQTGGVQQFSQYNLLTNIIETADTVVNRKGWNGATLRFGHEVALLPLACLLELDSCGRAVEDMSKLDEQWVSYRIYPMACNIQLVFYRPVKGKSGDILIKALLNEAEATLPLPTDNFPYYKWSDFRKYFTDKLSNFRKNYPEEAEPARENRGFPNFPNFPIMPPRQ